MELWDQNIIDAKPPTHGETLSPDTAMRHAILAAYKGMGRVSPNPLVGCVIVNRYDKFLACGYHERYGALHAEAHALAQIADHHELEGAKVYVTLEPCAHQGKQPSCAQTLKNYPIAQVLFGYHDPNPLVHGKGQSILQVAGKDCELYTGSLQSDIKESLHNYLWSTKHQKLFVALKVATDAQQNFALVGSQKLWITNPRSRQYAHFLRSFYDCIIVGKDTVKLDNPLLDTRHFSDATPVRPVFILDPEGELYVEDFENRHLRPQQSHVNFVVAKDSEVYQTSKTKEGLIGISCNQSGFDLEELTANLYARNLRSALLEGGAGVYDSFMAHDLVQRLYHFQAQHTLDGDQPRAWPIPKHTQTLHTHDLDGDKLTILKC